MYVPHLLPLITGSPPIKYGPEPIRASRLLHAIELSLDTYDLASFFLDDGGETFVLLYLDAGVHVEVLA